jgi:hypothetical protein
MLPHAVARPDRAGCRAPALACRLLTGTVTMKLTMSRIWRAVPVPILVVPRMPGRLVGLSMGMFVILRADHATDRATIVHELEHCKQFWRGWGVVHMWRYYFSRDYRLQAELEAFRAELDACGPIERSGRLEEAARALATGYHIGLDLDACKALLSCPPRSANCCDTLPMGEALRPKSSTPAWAPSSDTTLS